MDFCYPVMVAGIVVLSGCLFYMLQCGCTRLTFFRYAAHVSACARICDVCVHDLLIKFLVLITDPLHDVCGNYRNCGIYSGKKQ